MIAAWSYAASRLLALVAVALVAGWLFGDTWVWLAVLPLAFLGWQLANLHRLERWLALRVQENLIEASGKWAEIVAHVERLRRRNRLRKRRLAQLLREFRHSTDALPDGAILLNSRREILWCNEAAARLLGLRAHADRGLRFDNLVRHPGFAAHLDDSGAEGPVELASPIDDGVLLSLQTIPYGDEQSLVLVKDITYQSQLEQVRRDFVANASHELKSPLTVISGYLDDLVEDEKMNAVWGGPLREMQRQSQRMKAIVDDLLELSRLEAPGADAEQNEIDVAGLLALIRRETLALEARPAEIVLSIDSDARLLGRESEIYSAFSNLVGNAVKFTPADGRIEMCWRDDNGGAQMSVIDTGTGIPPEAIPRLTERFYRLDAGRVRSSGGTGLGLAIVKHALQNHQGTLLIESEPGKGSTFTCRFPAARIHRPAPAP
ncbi:MAG TPA: phosphate regulon sensor histidine kinase PhoR [Gammaproteobacteria bacterium]|nr:phosphate regulon sensor histidine kinase PhoR [Gammaproteobacteria bacterium]